MLDKGLMLVVRFVECLLRVYLSAGFEFYKIYDSVPSGNLFGIQVFVSSLIGMTNTPFRRLWCLVGRFCCMCWENPVRNIFSMSSGGSMLRSDNFSLLQASIVTIAEPSLPLLIPSPQRLTAWWCRFMCILFRVWLLHLRSTVEHCLILRTKGMWQALSYG